MLISEWSSLTYRVSPRIAKAVQKNNSNKTNKQTKQHRAFINKIIKVYSFLKSMYAHICEALPGKVNLVKETEKQREKRKSKKKGNGDQGEF